jgi:hypothetical protein
VPEITNFKGIEDAAILWVMDLERLAGRAPTDTRYRGAPADIESPPRVIEVKAVSKASARGEALALEGRQVEEARRNPNFYLYVVENVRQGDPREFSLRILHGERLMRLIDRAKPWGTYSVPFPVADYDDAPRSVDLGEELDP